MAKEVKETKTDTKHDLELYLQEAITISKIAGKVGDLQFDISFNISTQNISGDKIVHTFYIILMY